MTASLPESYRAPLVVLFDADPLTEDCRQLGVDLRRLLPLPADFC